ncbi:Zinc finger RING-type domain containing protein [Klebsormidium nitens]|uniref:Zinc finger RING-type domain containing protein n=1 Tax=Klebsormidium nitens TaxID=105231 RepID=A0A1Y1I9A5_KLENI|nr:Zinc finger RING-type domain containing protein [Klebsormidium nitens]|eukprot:GAQ86542.1 Zinc finger RING-type domain containing protein [Klebsormidium nitens]
MEDTDWAGEEPVQDVPDDTPPSDTATRFQDYESHSPTPQTLRSPPTPQTPEARTPGSASPLGTLNHSPGPPTPHSPPGGRQLAKGGVDDEGLLSGVCPICLQPVDGEAYLDPCFHRFCFSCILQWSEMGVRSGVPPFCPVCKGPFFTIIHDFRGTQFKRYEVLGGTSSVRFQLSEKHVLRRAVYEKGAEASAQYRASGGKAFAGGKRGGTSRRWLRCWVRRELQALLEEEDVEMVALHIVGSVELLAEQRRQRQKFGKNARPLLGGGSDSEGGCEGLVRRVCRPPPRKEKKLVFGKTSLVLSKAGLARRKARKGINGAVRVAPLPEKKTKKRGSVTSESGRSGHRVEKESGSAEKEGKRKQELAAEKVMRWLENGQGHPGEGLGQDTDRAGLADSGQGSAEHPPGVGSDGAQGVSDAGDASGAEAVGATEELGGKAPNVSEGVTTMSVQGRKDEAEGIAGQKAGDGGGVGGNVNGEGLGGGGQIREVEGTAAGGGTQLKTEGTGSEEEVSKERPGGTVEVLTPAEESPPAGGVNEETLQPEAVSAEDEEWLRVVAAAARPFIFENAHMFATELLAFLSSGLDIASYDVATLPAPPGASLVAAESGSDLRQGGDDELGGFAQRAGHDERPSEDIASLKRAIEEENEGDYYVEGGLRAERQRKKKKRVEYGSLWTAAKEDLDALPRADEGGVLGAELPPQRKEKRRKKRREEEGGEEGRPKKQRHSDKAEDDSDFERRQHRKRRRRRDRHRRHRAERSDSVDKSDSSLEKAVHAYRKKLRQRKKDGRRMSDGLPLSSTDDEAEGWADWRRRMKKLYRFCKTEVEEESEESEWGEGGVKSPPAIRGGGLSEGKGRGGGCGSGRRERGVSEREVLEQGRGARRRDDGTRSVDAEWFGESQREKRREKGTDPSLDERYEARSKQMGVPDDRRGGVATGSDSYGRRGPGDVAAAESRPGRGRFGDVSERGDDVSTAAGAGGLPRRGGLKRSWGEQDEGRGAAQDGSGKKQARVRWEDEESLECRRPETVLQKVTANASAKGSGVRESERWNGGERNDGYWERFVRVEEGREEVRGGETRPTLAEPRRGSAEGAGARRVVQSLSDLERGRKGGEEGSHYEGIAGQDANNGAAATPLERELGIEELQAELQEVELRKRALASLSHFLKARTKVGTAPNSPARGAISTGLSQRGGAGADAVQGGRAEASGHLGGGVRGRTKVAGGAKDVGLGRGGALAGSGVQSVGGGVGRAKVAGGLKVGVTRKVTAPGSVAGAVIGLGRCTNAKGAPMRKVVGTGVLQRPSVKAAQAAAANSPSGPRLAAPRIAQQLLAKGDGSPMRKTGPSVKKTPATGGILKQGEGLRRRIFLAPQGVGVANRGGGVQPSGQKCVVVRTAKGSAAVKSSGPVLVKRPLVQPEPTIGGQQKLPPGGQQKLPPGRPQKSALPVERGSQGPPIRPVVSTPGSSSVRRTVLAKGAVTGSGKRKAPPEAGEGIPGQVGANVPGQPVQKSAPVGNRLVAPSSKTQTVVPAGSGRNLQGPAPSPARLNPPGTKSGPTAATTRSVQAKQLPDFPRKAAQSFVPDVNSRPKVTPPTLVKPRVVQAPMTSPTNRSPPGVPAKLQGVRPQANPDAGLKPTDDRKRPIVAPGANAQKRTVTIAGAATAPKILVSSSAARSVPAKPGVVANAPLRAPAISARNPLAAPPRSFAPSPPSGYPGQSYGLSRPGSNKWQRSPGAAQPMQSPVTVPRSKNLQWVRKDAQPGTAVATKPGLVSKASTTPNPPPGNKLPSSATGGVRRPGVASGVAKVGRSMGKGEAGRRQDGDVRGPVSLVGNCVDKKIILVESKRSEEAKDCTAGTEIKR